MLQGLSIALVQEKADNISENFLYEIIHSLYQEKEVTKKVFNEFNEFNKVIKQNGHYIYEF